MICCIQRGDRSFLLISAINGEYYANLLQRLSYEIKKKGLHLTKKKVLFYHDNAPVHIYIMAMAKINEYRFSFNLPGLEVSNRNFPIDGACHQFRDRTTAFAVPSSPSTS